jgi:hypothetical protein
MSSSAEILFLSSNKFTGQLILSQKAEIDSPLRGLYLSDNQFNGPIPLILCEFKQLEAIFLDENELTGNLPTCLSLLDHLTQLYVFKNQLDGEIPQEFSVMLGLGKFFYTVLSECSGRRPSIARRNQNGDSSKSRVPMSQFDNRAPCRIASLTYWTGLCVF